jgi:thiol:disulfide interchange protein DsbC
MIRNLCLIFSIILILGLPAAAMDGGCGEGSCKDCHHLSTDEAKQILGRQVSKVNSVGFSAVPGLWLLQVERGGQQYPLYLDFSKKYVAEGNIFRLVEGRTVANSAQRRSQPLKKIDVSSIPLKDALILGKKQAPIKAFVITDPECPYCKRLHQELKQIVKERQDIAFHIKMFPLRIHPKARKESESIVCSKSLKMFEDSLAGNEIPDPNCKNDLLEKSIKFLKEHGIHSTPTIILPDGTVKPGFKKAAQLIAIIDQHKAKVAKK